MRAQNSTVIRPATSADAALLSSLAHQLLQHECALNKDTRELTQTAASAAEMRKQIRSPHIRFFIAEKASGEAPEIIGYIKVIIHGRRPDQNEAGALSWFLGLVEQTTRDFFNFILRPRPDFELIVKDGAEGPIGYIAGIFVRPEDRRVSVGRMLVGAAEEWLRSQGVKTSDLHVLSANKSAWRFWEEEGYRPLTMGMRKKLK